MSKDEPIKVMQTFDSAIYNDIDLLLMHPFNVLEGALFILSLYLLKKLITCVFMTEDLRLSRI